MAVGPILRETKKSVNAAKNDHLALDAGAVAVLLALARQIDYLAVSGGLSVDGKLDNVSIPTYLRYCESLGLTPAGRVKLDKKQESPGGKLAQLRAVGAVKSG